MGKLDSAAYVLALNALKKAKEALAQIELLPDGVVLRGEVNYYSDLPANPKYGDAYTVKYTGSSGTNLDGTEYAWATNNTWVALGPDKLVAGNGINISAQNEIAVKINNEFGTALLGTYLGVKRANPEVIETVGQSGGIYSNARSYQPIVTDFGDFLVRKGLGLAARTFTSGGVTYSTDFSQTEKINACQKLGVEEWTEATLTSNAGLFATIPSGAKRIRFEGTLIPNGTTDEIIFAGGAYYINVNEKTMVPVVINDTTFTYFLTETGGVDEWYICEYDADASSTLKVYYSMI